MAPDPRRFHGAVAIIGGGPIGVEAALYGVVAGFDVHLFERGRLAENVRQWGHIRAFTTWERNRSPLAVRLLQNAGIVLPPGDTASLGDELAAYVEHLAAQPALAGRLHPHTAVVSLTREACLKSDFADDPRRADVPFRLHLRCATGDSIFHANAIIDATGVYATPNWLGSGGAPCPGEQENRAAIDYHLPDVAGRDLARFSGRHTLVVGSGHSAASTLRSIADLFTKAPSTQLTWAVRRAVPSHGLPYTLIEDDPSPHRNALHQRANELAMHPAVAFRPRTVVAAMERAGTGWRVTLDTWQPGRAEPVSTIVACDNIVAHTGFRPDPSLWRELQVAVHPATDGPAALAERLLENNRRGGVGLSTGYAERAPVENEEAAPAPAVDRWRVILNDPLLLCHPEPNFFVLGIKSYGRDAGFLMQNGFRQVRDVYKVLSGDPGLDLYDDALE